MCGIQNVVEVVIVVVYLRGRELTLVHDILGRKRANIEPFRKGTLRSKGTRMGTEQCSVYNPYKPEKQ
jgi:hypothetical protein